MNTTPGIWEKLSRLVLLLITIACLLAIARWYLPVIQKNERVRKKIIQLEQEVKKEEETARQLKTSIDALQHDPDTVERKAREKLGYAKPGETVIRFDETSTNRVPVSP
jgi:cell division protein FtsB